ncbi:MAG: VanZ family protein [Clostridia bacterium]|nr:VanZ family protein [Clostridia bacterium]
MKKRTIYIILAVLTTVFIFYCSAQPAVESAKSSERITANVFAMLMRFGIHLNSDMLEGKVRKMAHFAEFFAQAFFISKSFTGKYRKRIVYVLFLGLLTACADEYIQTFFDGRSGEIRDIFIDFGGTAFSTAVCGIFRKRR